MSCLIYPNFPCEIPIPLMKVLEESGHANRMLEYAIQEYQDRKMGGGKHFVVHRKSKLIVEKPLSFWIRKLFWKDEPIVVLESDLGQNEQIEDAYIAKDLQFFLRGRILRYKDTGGVQAVQLSHIEPVYKNTKLDASKDVVDGLADKLLNNYAKINKSASFAMDPIDPTTYATSASYAITSSYSGQAPWATICVTGSYLPQSVLSIGTTYSTPKISLDQIQESKDLVTRIDMEAIYKIFQDMIDSRGKNPSDVVDNPITNYFKNKP